MILLIILSNLLWSQELYQNSNSFNFNVKSIVAKVDSINITAEEFYYSYEFGPAFIKRLPDSKEKHLEYLINEKLLALEGYAKNVDSERQVINSLNAFKADIATEEMFKDIIQSRIKITEEEIDTVINQKKIDVSLKWIFKKSKDEIFNVLKKLKNGVPFDTLFNLQFNDSTVIDDRTLETSRYQLGRKNPALVSIIDTLHTKTYSAPIHTEDGWYILFLNKIYSNPLVTETDYTKLREESIRAVSKNKMDDLSDRYVNKLMISKNPIIKSAPKRIVRSYIAKYVLDKTKYKQWNLKQKLNTAINDLGINDSNKIPEIDLVVLDGQNISISEFLDWFWLRDNFIKFNESTVNSFSKSLDNIIWRMVRDELLTREAYKNNYQYSPAVIKQLAWWKDKITSSAVKSKIKNSIMVERQEVNIQNSSTSNIDLETEFNRKVFLTISKLKKQYKVKIDKKVLDQISVSTENDKRAVEFYTVKKGGLIPRTPYPTIDFDWAGWEL